MAVKHVAVCRGFLALFSRYAHARYCSQLIDRFLYLGNHRNQKSSEIKGSCQPHAPCNEVETLEYSVHHVCLWIVSLVLQRSFISLAKKSKLAAKKSVENVPFLTRELRMRNTSYHELWENVSLARWAVHIMQMRCARGLLLNCCSSLIKISCFKGLNYKRYKLKKTRPPKMRTSRIVKSMSSTSSHWMRTLYGFYRNRSRWSRVTV